MTTPQTDTMPQPAPVAMMPACLLDALRAEMGALQAILPGFAGKESAEQDDAFENTPV